MSDNPPRIREYPADGIVVRYEPRRCIHAAECVHGLSQVFDPERRPWIDPQQAGPDAIADVIQRCPTGALTYHRTDGGPVEEQPEENTIRPMPDGPLHLHGRLRLLDAQGSILWEGLRAALCRCGASGNKPFCDNSHLEESFDDGGALGAGRLVPEPADDPTLEIRLVAGGPLLLRGPAALVSADGKAQMVGAKGALCRCGRSQTKPFCDGSHKNEPMPGGP